MNVIKGTYRISLYDFINQYAKNIRHLEYTEEEAHDCIEFLSNGVLQYLKIYVINGKLHSCCKLIAIARDFMENKVTDRTGRYFSDYDENDRFYLAHCVKFDYMECISKDTEKVERLVELIGAK
jgi:hypothetical protein